MDLPDVDDLKIFVPEWGWVGSFELLVTDFLKKFSSPLGDGLVQNNLKSKTIIGKFSSPSGVGLVPI